MELWQANAIKQIYGNSSLNNTFSISDVENYYLKSNIYKNATEIPDIVVPLGYQYVYTDDNDDEQIGYAFSHAIKNPVSTNPNIVVSSVSDDYYKGMSSYYKLLDSKDIDWDNAYLRYSHQLTDSVDNLECSKPISYEKIDITTGKPYHNTYTNSAYIYIHKIPSYINSTYEFCQVLDYINNRLKAVRFMVEIVKEQKATIEQYKSLHNNS